MIEHHQCLMSAELLITYVKRAALQLAGIAGLSAVDVKNPFRISRCDKAHCIVGIIRGHGNRRHYQYPMGIQRTRLMCLGATNDNPIFALFHHMNIQIRISLLAGRKTAIAFRIGHCAIDSPISLLHFSQKVLKPLMIFCPQFQIHFKGDAVYCVDGVHPYAALETGRCLLSKQTLHLDFFDQIFRTLVQVTETIDLLPGQMRVCCHQVFIFRLFGQLIGRFDRVHRRPDNRMIHRIFHLFALQIHFEI